MLLFVLSVRQLGLGVLGCERSKLSRGKLHHFADPLSKSYGDFRAHFAKLKLFEY